MDSADEFAKRQLAELAGLPAGHQAAFAAYVAQRCLPLYPVLNPWEAEGRGVLELALGRVWESVWGRAIDEAEVEAIYARIMGMLPEEDLTGEEAARGLAGGVIMQAAKISANPSAELAWRIADEHLLFEVATMVDSDYQFVSESAASALARLKRALAHPRCWQVRVQLREAMAFLTQRASLVEKDVDLLRALADAHGPPVSYAEKADDR